MSDSSSDSSSSSQPSRPRRWQCFLGCGQRYMKSSGRSIRRHVLLCYRRQFASDCKGVSDAQIHDLLVSQEEKGAIRTGLKRWRLRRSRRLAMDLPPHERWDCPNQCGRYFRSTSSRSIAKHKLSCSYQADTDATLPVHCADTAASAAPSNVRTSSMPSLLSPAISASSSSSLSSSFSFISSSSPHSSTGSLQRLYGASSDAPDTPKSTQQPTQQPAQPTLMSPPRIPSGISSHLNADIKPVQTSGSSVIRPIPRLHATLPLIPPLSPFRITAPTTADKSMLPPLSKLPTASLGDGLSSLLLHPSTSAFRPLYPSAATTATAAAAAVAASSFFSSSSSSLPPSLFNLSNLSPLHALTSPMHHGYVLCSFPAQQVQVPLISWPC